MTVCIRRYPAAVRLVLSLPVNARCGIELRPTPDGWLGHIARPLDGHHYPRPAAPTRGDEITVSPPGHRASNRRPSPALRDPTSDG